MTLHPKNSPLLDDFHPELWAPEKSLVFDPKLLPGLLIDSDPLGFPSPF